MGPAGSTADVEGPHRQLRTRLTDGLSRNHAHGFAQVNHLPGGQISTVALYADTTLGFAGQHGADLDLFDTSRLNLGGQVLGDFFVDADNGLTGQGILYILERNATDDAVAQRFDDFAAFHDRGDVDAIERLAIIAGDDYILRHVDQAPGQVPRVGGFERGVGQALASAVGGNKVLQHGQPLAEVGGNRRLDNLARGFGH